MLTITPERLRQNQSHLGTVSAPRPASQLGQKGTFVVPGWERENNTVQFDLEEGLLAFDLITRTFY